MSYRVIQEHRGESGPSLGKARGQEQAQQERLLLRLAEIVGGRSSSPWRLTLTLIVDSWLCISISSKP